MKVVQGFENAVRALCAGRGLNLDNAPAQVMRKTLEAFGEPLTPGEVVDLILNEVKARGDDALRELSRKLDSVDLEELEVPGSAIADAYRKVPEDVVEALKMAAGRVRRFHECTGAESWIDKDEGHGELVSAVDRVGIYVPGGTAIFPSTLLMSVIPARVAGVREVIVCTPSGKQGPPHPAVLVAADIAGVDRLFHVGGAQAIAAMAYGTESVPSVDLICGPGGLFVTLAKKRLYGEVGIDGLYGPTETAVIADDSANPTLCAADLVAQAEHDVLATPVLITTSQQVAEVVQREASLRAAAIQRSAVATASLEQRGCIAIVDTLEEAFDLANQFAPEHVSLMVKDPWRHLDRVRNAGAVFLGEFSHEVLGDYVAGPSHIMPTGGTARFSSGLSVRSFQKVTSVVGLDKQTASSLATQASIIARAEGFTGHAEAAEIRDELYKE